MPHGSVFGSATGGKLSPPCGEEGLPGSPRSCPTAETKASRNASRRRRSSGAPLPAGHHAAPVRLAGEANREDAGEMCPRRNEGDTTHCPDLSCSSPGLGAPRNDRVRSPPLRFRHSLRSDHPGARLAHSSSPHPPARSLHGNPRGLQTHRDREEPALSHRLDRAQYPRGRPRVPPQEAVAPDRARTSQSPSEEGTCVAAMRPRPPRPLPPGRTSLATKPACRCHVLGATPRTRVLGRCLTQSMARPRCHGRPTLGYNQVA